MASALVWRHARLADVSALRVLIDAAMNQLMKPYLDEPQIASSRVIMGLDTQLIEDGTYYVVERDGGLAGCGGWSKRATLYGGDSTSARDPSLVDPARDPARVRAMYTHPDHVRRGVGRLILSLCEKAARKEGFRSVELMATLSGEPLYRACGYDVIEHITDSRGGTAVPLLRMGKRLDEVSSYPAGNAGRES